MDKEVVAVFIPIVMFIVTGLVIVTAFYLRSKERQMLIEKGLSLTEMKEFYKNKKDPYVLTKIGIIAIFFGLGLGFGIMFQENSTNDFWIPLFLFVSTGVGFVIAGLFGKSRIKRETEI